MDREIYQKNLESIRKRYEALADFIENKKYHINTDIKVETENALNGDCIFGVSNKEKIWYLNGRYNPRNAGMDWLDSVGNIEDFATLLIIGIHDGIHIYNILNEIKQTNRILIYEPSLEIFLKALENVDLSFLFQANISLGIIIDGFNENDAEAYINRMISYDNLAMLKIYLSGNYDNLFSEKIEAFIKTVKLSVSHTVVNWNTKAYFAQVSAKNIFCNCRYMYDGYSMYSLHNILPPDIPTIIVSAGPSLNKNINDLKAAVGRANIIATDTAMKPLLNAGIIPNLFVVIDGRKKAILFEHEKISEVPMVTTNIVSVEPMKIHKGKKFYYATSELENETMKRTLEKDAKTVPLASLESGGSVATMAYSLGIFMGSKTIILMGQDLAMTGNRTHADGTFQEKMDEIDINSKQYFEVEAIDGGIVLTRGDFKIYLDWFERKIEKCSSVRVIDATEGGAKIHGAEIMSLREAIDSTCEKEFDVSDKVSQLPQMFGEKGKEEFLNILEEIPEKLLEVKEKAIEGVRQYKKLEKFSKKKKFNHFELQKLLKQIKETNEYMENDYMANIASQALKDIEYMLIGTIYQSKQKMQDELLDIAQNGKIMLEGMRDIIDEMIELSEEEIIPFVNMQYKENII